MPSLFLFFAVQNPSECRFVSGDVKKKRKGVARSSPSSHIGLFTRSHGNDMYTRFHSWSYSRCASNLCPNYTYSRLGGFGRSSAGTAACGTVGCRQQHSARTPAPGFHGVRQRIAASQRQRGRGGGGGGGDEHQRRRRRPVLPHVGSDGPATSSGSWYTDIALAPWECLRP